MVHSSEYVNGDITGLAYLLIDFLGSSEGEREKGILPQHLCHNIDFVNRPEGRLGDPVDDQVGTGAIVDLHPMSAPLRPQIAPH